MCAQSCLTLCDPHGLSPARPLCIPDKNTGAGCHFLLLLQGIIFRTRDHQIDISCVSCIDRRVLYHSAAWEAQQFLNGCILPPWFWRQLRVSGSPWQATVHGTAETDTTELLHFLSASLILEAASGAPKVGGSTVSGGQIQKSAYQECSLKAR